MAKLDQQPEFEIAKDAQEYYVDSLNISTQLYGSTLFLGKTRPPDGKPLVVSIVKCSPQMLKVLGLIVDKNVRNYEREIGPISLPKQLLHNLGLEEQI